MAAFPSLGVTELAVILVIALVIFGPARLPQIGKSLGKALHEFRETSTATAKSLQEGIDGKVEDEEEEKKPDKKE